MSHAAISQNEALLQAVQKGDLELCHAAIASGADVNAVIDNDGYSSFSAAAYRGHTEICRLMLEHGAQVDFQDKKEWTPLLTASAEGHADVCRLLVKAGAGVNVCCQEGCTPLQAAAQWGNVETVRILIEAGAKIDFWALQAACSRGEVAMVACLFDSEKGLLSKALLRQALISAAGGGHMECCRMLIAQKAEVTPDTLAAAAANNHVEVCRYLLDLDVDVNEMTTADAMPLHAAAKSGSLEAVRFLIEQGANVNAASKSDGMFEWTPLHAAVAASSTRAIDVCRELIKHGADTTKVCKASPDDFFGHNAVTPFQYAVEHGSIDLIDYFIRELGESLEQRTVEDKTLFDLAESTAGTRQHLLALQTEIAINGAMTVNDAAPRKKRSAGMSPF